MCICQHYSDDAGGERGDQAAAAAAADPGQLQAQTGGQTQPPPVTGLVTDNFDIDIYGNSLTGIFKDPCKPDCLLVKVWGRSLLFYNFKSTDCI